MIDATGALVGATTRSRIAQLTSSGLLTVMAGVATVLGFAAVDLTIPSETHMMRVGLLATSSFVAGLSSSILSINLSTLRQRVTPLRLMGRVFAAQRMALSALAILGGLTAGIMVERFGFPIAVYGTSLVSTAVPIVIGVSRLWSMEDKASSQSLK